MSPLPLLLHDTLRDWDSPWAQGRPHYLADPSPAFL